MLVDVDGTLVGPYRNGRRELRASACKALKLLAQQAPVFLWSIAGHDNGSRLVQEYPELKPYIAGSFGKEEFPLHLIDHPFAIDDDGVDDAVLRCRNVVLDESYEDGEDSGCLLEAAHIVVDTLQQEGRARQE